MTSLFLLSALGAWTPTGEENGCTFYKGATQGSVTPLRAECEWPIAPDRLHKLLGVWADHDDYFSTVAKSEPIGAHASGGQRVRQVHEASGISDREIILRMWTQPIAGGTRYAWERDSSQDGLKGEGVAPNADTGLWEVSAAPGNPSASRVVCELLYDPGGSVPGFVVRWFQGSGFRTMVSELRTWAEKH